MRFLSILLWALMALVPGAYAQNPGSEKAMFDQVRQGEYLPSPASPPDAPDLARSLQVELKRVGCFEGAVDGVWGSITKGALAEFVRHSKLEVPSDVPTSIAVETLKSQRARICPLDCGANRIERNGACVAKAAPDNRPAKPQNVGETKRPPRAKPENEGSNSGMCLRNDGRTTALVPCNEAPGSRKVY
jgi:hypothetical protein